MISISKSPYMCGLSSTLWAAPARIQIEGCREIMRIVYNYLLMVNVIVTSTKKGVWFRVGLNQLPSRRKIFVSWNSRSCTWYCTKMMWIWKEWTDEDRRTRCGPGTVTTTYIGWHIICMVLTDRKAFLDICRLLQLYHCLFH